MSHESQEPHHVEPDEGDSAPHHALEPEVSQPDTHAMSLLIVDDVEAQGALLKGILQRAGYRHVHYLREPLEVAAYAQQNPPDLVLLDLVMPHMSGFQVMAVLQELFPDGYLPILMLTSDDRREVKQKALELGATDFLPKPFDAAEVSLRVKNLLKARGLYAQLQEQNRSLEAKVEERTRLLESSHMEMLTRLARAAEYRDEESKEHIWRVARTAERVARELGLPDEQAEVLLRAARLHDVGKISVPEGILYKPGTLTAAEFEVVKAHTTVGAQLLSGGQSAILRMAETVALTHHERWDGSGYPQGLKGLNIPIEGRIMAVADTYDALTHDRTHRRAWSSQEAMTEISLQSGKAFDPGVVEAFLSLYERGVLTF